MYFATLVCPMIGAAPEASIKSVCQGHSSDSGIARLVIARHTDHLWDRDSAGLSIEQPTWDPKTKRFYVSVPVIAGNPAGCTAERLRSARASAA
jgi:hypothetical protein